jgi:DNA damage-binding protein 1
VRLVRLPGLEEVSREYLGGEIIPRSVLLAKFERLNYLLCALGDGTLFYFVLAANGSLTDKKKVMMLTAAIRPMWSCLVMVRVDPDLSHG